jgi:hypothetical protein
VSKRTKGQRLAALAAFAVAAVAVPSGWAWTVTMDANPALKRTHTWTIEKSVSQSSLTLKAGESATVTYSVKASSAAPVDSDWSVSGTMEMTEDPDITIGSVVFDVLPAPAIPATHACMPVTFPVNLGIEGLTCTYSAALPDASPRTAHMKAIVSAPAGTRQMNVPFTFASAAVNEVDECVNVTDSMAGALGTVCAADAPKTFTYSTTIGPYGTDKCGEHTVDNTASFLTNDTRATGSASAAVKVTVKCDPPAPGSCHETVNPAGKPAVGDNGHPDDPFGGDAVPGGKSTSPGTRGNGPINSDGFYLVGGLIFSDATPIPYPGGGFVWPANTTVKYTERGNPTIKISAMAGPHSVITWQIQAPGDLYAKAPKGDPNAVFCGVPPPPF